MDMNEIKNNSPKRPVIFYYAIALIVLLALNFLLVPWMSERSVTETGYNEFLSQVSAGNVTEVEVQEQNSVIYYKVKVNGKEQICKTGTMNDPTLTQRLYDCGATFSKDIEKIYFKDINNDGIDEILICKNTSNPQVEVYRFNESKIEKIKIINDFIN